MKNKMIGNIEIVPITDESAYQNACDLIEELMDMGEFENAGVLPTWMHWPHWPKPTKPKTSNLTRWN